MAPLTPSSSQEIICISSPDTPARTSTKKTEKGGKRKTESVAAQPSTNKRKPADDTPSHSKKRAVGSSQSRSRVTERMLSSLSSTKNPITHSNAFQNTQHVHSCSTGHQQRGGDRGFWATSRDMGLKPEAGPEHTYWSVRTANVEAAAKEKVTSIFTGCIIAINGPTGPKVSNLQLQNIITANGGRYVPHQSSRCTHVVAANLSGSKAQKYINGQGSRGASQRTVAVKVDWVLDCVAQGKRLSEAGYLVVEDPTQHNLFTAFGIAPKKAAALAESKATSSFSSAAVKPSSK